ncbi:MAG: recombinase family protein [Aliiglaciecola sp.]
MLDQNIISKTIQESELSVVQPKFDTFNQPVLISYVRFSTMEQQKGQSLERQMQFARNIAQKKGMRLGENMTIKDLGLSAYHQTNVTKGGLGTFLKAVEDDKVPPGSILVIESLDRISRASPIESQAIVSQIINAGITVITAIDGKEYDTLSIKQNPMDLIYMILILIRAHEESDMKSKRVLSALLAQCNRWLNGERGFRVKCGKAPSWVKWDNEINSYKFKEPEASIMRRKIELYREGHGGLKIAETINQEYGSGTVHHTGANIYKEVKRRTLIGENNVTVDGEKFCLHDYYPSLISVSEFNELVAGSSARGATKYSQKFVGILSGIDVFKCGSCEHSVGSHVIYRGKELKDVPRSHKRYGCVEARRNNNCTNKETYQISAIENAVVTYCQDSVNLRKVLNQTSNQKPIIETLNAIEARQKELTSNIDYLIETSIKSRSASLAEKLHSLEEELETNESKLTRLKSELRNMTSLSAEDVVTEWQELTKNLDNMTSDERLKIRLLIKDTFKSITLGTNDKKDGIKAAIDRAKKRLLSQDNNEAVELTLKFHNGLVRVISVDKYSGKLIKGFDIN